MQGTRREPGRQPLAADRAEREVRRYLRRWLPWAAISVLGFLVLWVTGLAETQAFYVWAIGWALAWGAWVHADYARHFLTRGRDRTPGDEEP